MDSVRIPLDGEALGRSWSAKIDAEDEELVRALGSWSVEGPDKRGYYDWRSHTPYAYSAGPVEDSDPATSHIFRLRPRMRLHDLIAGAGAGEEVFPANGDGLDCRKSNLRVRKVKTV